MLVRDLMSLFFVLSGFVIMHSHYSDSFKTTKQKWNFWVNRFKKIYPAYIIILSFYIPSMITLIINLDQACIFKLYCVLMQIFLLNCWAGCGVYKLFNMPSWYLSTLAWLWFCFPFMQSTLKDLFEQRTWIKILGINVISTVAIFYFSEYNIFTICTLPALRIGEFIIGCGAACYLERSMNNEHKGEWTWVHWSPLVLSVAYLATVYTFLALPHEMKWLCMHESEHDTECRLWHKADQIDTNPPCHAIWDKYFNKHAFIWSVIIYTIASAEKFNETSSIVRLLKHDIFKDLSSFSLTLYLGHSPADWALKEISRSIGILNFWHDDVFIMAIYVICYILHLFTKKISALAFK